MASFPDLEPVCCSMSSSNCCFLTCIQISQEAGQVVWYSYLLKTFPEFVVIHTVKGFVSNQAAGHCRPHLCQRLLDTHRQVWVSLFGGRCSFVLGSDVHKVLCVPSKSLFPQSCVCFGGSMVGLMATSSKRTYAMPRATCTQSPCPCSRPLLTCTSAGDIQTQFCLSPCGVPGSW